MIPHPRRPGYEPARARLTIEVWSPFRRGIWRISPQQYRVMVAVHDGRLFTQRALAADLGIRQSSLRHALKSLETGGLITLRPSLGRRGRTWAQVRPDVILLTEMNGSMVPTSQEKTTSIQTVNTPLFISTSDAVQACLAAMTMSPSGDRNPQRPAGSDQSFGRVQEQRLLEGVRLIPEPI